MWKSATLPSRPIVDSLGSYSPTADAGRAAPRYIGFADQALACASYDLHAEMSVAPQHRSRRDGDAVAVGIHRAGREISHGQLPASHLIVAARDDLGLDGGAVAGEQVQQLVQRDTDQPIELRGV